MNSFNPKTIHRELLFRIGSMGLLIAVLVGIGVWHIETRDAGDQLVRRAEDGIRYLNNDIRHMLNDTGNIQPPVLERRLLELMREGPDIRFGRFVWISIYDLTGRRIASAKHYAYEHIEEVERISGKFDEDMGAYTRLNYKLIELQGLPHIQFIAPLKNNLNERSAIAETFFAISPEALSAIRARAVKLSLSAFFIVVLTTVLLYPAVVALLNRIALLTSKLYDANLEMLKVLGSAVAKRDSVTDSHNYRVTMISVKLAEAIGLPRDDIQRLIKGAFLHDVGKIGIEDHILHKPGSLNEDEFSAMKNHVPLGLDIVKNADWLQDAVDIVGYHHEKYDGSGYSRGVDKNRIPRAARVFAIADVFDALTSRRPYKEAYSYEKTMEIIRSGRGVHFDPAYLDAFERIAPSLFEAYAGREDDRLKVELDGILKTYFYE